MKSLKNKVNIDVTYRCPLECPFCDRQKYKKSKERIKESRDLPISDFKKILSFFDKITFCGQISDPIYHPKFHKLMEMFSESNCSYLKIYTNGTRKSKEWWEKSFTIDDRVDWYFALDGTNQETANIYRKNTNFQEVFDTMILGKSLGASIYWQFIPFKHNEHQIEEYFELCEKYDIIPFMRKSSRWIPYQEKKYGIYPPTNKEYIKK